MQKQLTLIFQETLQATQKVIDPEQEDVLFTLSCDLFFSHVSPVKYITGEADLKEGNYNDMFIVSRVVGVDEPHYAEKIYGEEDVEPEYYMCQTVPIDYKNYELSQPYISFLREVINYFLSESEKDNFQLMRQAGADIDIPYEDTTLEELRNRLDRHFDIEPIAIVM